MYMDISRQLHGANSIAVINGNQKSVCFKGKRKKNNRNCEYK